jgi:hypothetical protein
LTGLPFGRYRLEVSKAGFATQSIAVDVKSAAPLERMLVLALASQATRMDVVAATPLAGTDLPLDEIPAPVQTTMTSIDAFADGSTETDGVPVDTRANLRGLVSTASLYAMDPFHVTKSLTLMLSGRYNRTSLQNIDQRPPAEVAGSRRSLNGQYVFERFNPAIG